VGFDPLARAVSLDNHLPRQVTTDRQANSQHKRNTYMHVKPTASLHSCTHIPHETNHRLLHTQNEPLTKGHHVLHRLPAYCSRTRLLAYCSLACSFTTSYLTSAVHRAYPSANCTAKEPSAPHAPPPPPPLGLVCKGTQHHWRCVGALGAYASSTHTLHIGTRWWVRSPSIEECTSDSRLSLGIRLSLIRLRRGA